MKIKKIIFACTFLILLNYNTLFAQTSQLKKSLADHWEYIGVAVEENDYHIWGSSPIMDDEGRVHLFLARWTNELGVDPGWRSHSEVAHYVSDKPEGPFVFVDIALKGTGKDTWDKYAPHNPAIHKVGDQYVLLYIANDNFQSPPHSSNQNIGMAISENLNGPWKKVGKDGLLLKPSTNPKMWTYKSICGMSNPAFLQHPNGGFMLYFKVKHKDGIKMGVAFSEHLEGPYVQYPEPVTKNNQIIEDGYAFVYNDKICLMTTDNHGMIKRGGGILWSSDDGINFSNYEPGFNLFSDYIGKNAFKNSKMIYGTDYKFERPQILLINNEPAYMYAPSGVNKDGRKGTASHILKFNK